MASPLRDDDLQGLPATTLLTAEYDPLRDEGEAFAERLQAAGVAVRLQRCDGMVHGFVSLAPFVEAAARALQGLRRTSVGRCRELIRLVRLDEAGRERRF